MHNNKILSEVVLIKTILLFTAHIFITMTLKIRFCGFCGKISENMQ